MQSLGEFVVGTVYAETRRLEIPIKYRGIDYVVIARENNDGDTIAYVYALTAEQNALVEAGGGWEYPVILLSNGEEENCFGAVDFSGTNEEYCAKRDIAWNAAQAQAYIEAEYLKGQM